MTTICHVFLQNESLRDVTNCKSVRFKCVRNSISLTDRKCSREVVENYISAKEGVADKLKTILLVAASH